MTSDSEHVQVEVGGKRYDWIDGWATALGEPETRTSWPHSAVAWSRRGELWTFHPALAETIAFDRDGRFLRSFPCPIAEAHGLTLVEEGGEEFLWLADSGGKKCPEYDYKSAPGAKGAVVKMSLKGELVRRLPTPDHPAYLGGPYAPTWVGVNEQRFGGNGDVWVADGYGQSLVHRFSEAGVPLGTLTGEEGAGRFRGPHLAFLDTRRSEPEFYIADRGNHRIQVYGTDGRFRRLVGGGTLSSPTAFAIDGSRLLVMEFNPARMLVLDGADHLCGMVGENLAPLKQPSFPFVRDAEGRPAIPQDMGQGKFGVPHSVAMDDRGDLYFTEVAYGSRFTKLRRVPGEQNSPPP